MICKVFVVVGVYNAYCINNVLCMDNFIFLPLCAHVRACAREPLARARALVAVIKKGVF